MSKIFYRVNHFFQLCLSIVTFAKYTTIDALFLPDNLQIRRTLLFTHFQNFFFWRSKINSKTKIIIYIPIQLLLEDSRKETSSLSPENIKKFVCLLSLLRHLRNWDSTQRLQRSKVLFKSQRHWNIIHTTIHNSELPEE